jgi:hypothetical protein
VPRNTKFADGSTSLVAEEFVLGNAKLAVLRNGNHTVLGPGNTKLVLRNK